MAGILTRHIAALDGIETMLQTGEVVETSGLMVVAKHDAAHEELARQFHDREVEKEYVTLVWGEEGGGSAKPVVERHVQTEIRAAVSPVPYAEVVRASYRPR